MIFVVYLLGRITTDKAAIELTLASSSSSDSGEQQQVMGVQTTRNGVQYLFCITSVTSKEVHWMKKSN
jgi:hypothetical protein